MPTLLQDFRFCLRQLLKSPGFALTAIVSLALGIGATTAVFSVIYAIMVNPYPYANSDRMVHMRLRDNTGQEEGVGIRVALGAQRSHVLRIVFASTAAAVCSGIAAGIVLTIALNKILARWAEGSSHDPLILFAVTLLLGVVAAGACSGPARRAVKIDPMTALRYE